MKILMTYVASALFFLGISLLTMPVAVAATNCELIEDAVNKTLTLRRNCWTEETIVIPDGYTLEGRNRRIQVRDPAEGGFRGAVIRNQGAWMGVNQVRLRGRRLEVVCQSGEDLLVGILLAEASGFVRHSEISSLHKTGSNCPEGYGIEVRNPPFDGSTSATKTIEIAHNRIDDYQAAGIFVNGDVVVEITHNQLGTSANQRFLAATAIQLAHGAGGTIAHNRIDPNSWCCEGGAGSGILLFLARDGFVIWDNRIVGNGDVGIFVIESNHGTITDNHLQQRRQKGFYSVGIENFGISNQVDHNRVFGFQTPIWGEAGSNNQMR